MPPAKNYFLFLKAKLPILLTSPRLWENLSVSPSFLGEIVKLQLCKSIHRASNCTELYLETSKIPFMKNRKSLQKQKPFMIGKSISENAEFVKKNVENCQKINRKFTVSLVYLIFQNQVFSNSSSSI